MPGARTGAVSEQWFEECFGVKEGQYFSTQRNFEMKDEVLVSLRNKRQFHVGAFEVLTVEALQQKKSYIDKDAGDPPDKAAGLTFQNCIGDIRALHLDKANEGAVFQVMSQYNCLQMIDPKCRPEDGVTEYANDTTQGSACALSCPAALIYRNYLCNHGAGQGYTNHIECLFHMGQEVHNKIKGYWRMQSGFCMPSVGGIGTLSKMIEDDKALAATLHSKLAVGINWDTEVDGGTHRVCQVFSSAAPVAFTKRSCNAEDWAPFARLLLAATFDATLTVATILAAKRKQRVTVFLTAVGAGAYGNRANWIAEGIEQALSTHAAAPLDVVLLHCAALPADGPYKSLEDGRDPPTSMVSGSGAAPATEDKQPTDGSKLDDLPLDKTVMERIMAIYQKFDANGDGDIDRHEFTSALRKLDEDFFKEDVIDKLIEAADANGDGKVHYAEFVAWVTGEDSAATTRLLSSGALAALGAAVRDEKPGAVASEGLPEEAYQKAIKLCGEWDKDLDGAISCTEMKDALGTVFPKWKKDDIAALIEVVDLNGDGMIPFDEFLQWLKVEPKERLSFEDFLHQFVVGAAGSPSVDPGGRGAARPAVEPTGASEPEASGAAASRGAREDDPATKKEGGADSEEDEIIQWFTHPLLQRVGVTGGESSRSSKDAVTVKVDKYSSSYSSRSRSSHGSSNKGIRKDYDGSLYMSLPAPILKSSHGSLLLPLLDALAEAYGTVMSTFCQSLTGPSPIKPTSFLRLAPIQAVDNWSLGVEHRPNVTFAAIALAIARLSPEHQDALAETSIELSCEKRSDFEKGHQEALEKAQAVASGLQLPHAGRLKERGDGYKYLRKENDDEARLVRLSAFMMTQRAICSRGYELPDGKVSLQQVENMVKGTKVVYAKDADIAPDTSGRNTIVKTAEELGWNSHCTVMEASQKLAEAGKQVVAVNAAAAYHAGGGCSSGGRHALEEAWCTISTMYRSVRAVESVKLTAGGFEQHIPTLGCLVSPKVEIFREPTNDGYGFLLKPVELCGVLSIAMFNRNPNMSDSPLDSPGDPADYVMQTKSKLEAMVVSAIQLGADVLVITDVGCGVFKNDPVVVGGCLGAILQKYDGHLEQIVMCCNKTEFTDACMRAFKGEDPRETCENGKYCREMGIPGHCARLVHPSLGEDDSICPPCKVDPINALVELVANPEPVSKPMCRYGKYCHTMTAEHRAKFDHPEPEPYHYGSSYGSSYGGSYGGSLGAGSSYGTSRYGSGGHSSSYGDRGHSSSYYGSAGAGSGGHGSSSHHGSAAHGSSAAGAAGRTHSGGASGSHGTSDGGSPSRTSHGAPSGVAGGRSATHGAGAAAADPDPDDPGPSISRTKSRPICKYGERCYNTNAKHLEEFAHPWKEGETPEEAKARRDITLAHELLTLAKDGKWTNIMRSIQTNKDVVNIRPESRGYGLIHFALYQVEHEYVKKLVEEYGADLNMKTRDGSTCLEVLQDGIKKTPLYMAAATKFKDDELLRYVRRKTSGGEGPASPGDTGHHSHTGGSGAGESGMSVTGHGAGGGDPDRVKYGGVKLEVVDCPIRDLEGDYQELQMRLNDHPVFLKGIGATRRYIFFHGDHKYGWSIDKFLDSGRPLAYLSGITSARLHDDPCDKPLHCSWRVLNASLGIPKPDYGMDIRKLRGT